MLRKVSILVAAGDTMCDPEKDCPLSQINRGWPPYVDESGCLRVGILSTRTRISLYLFPVKRTRPPVTKADRFLEKYALDSPTSEGVDCSILGMV